MSSILRSCPLCGGSAYSDLYEVPDHHYGIEGLHAIVSCNGCSLVSLKTAYSDEELFSLYPSDYYAYRPQFRAAGSEEIWRNILCYRIGTKDPSFETPGRMLDLGCGSGWFIAQMRDQGWQVDGVEISSAAAEVGRTMANLNIFSGGLTDAHFPSNHFDYVRANHSFEHMCCPNETLDEIYRILKPGGRLLIGVPNQESLNSAFFGRYWWYRGAPVHPFTYSPSTLSRFLVKHGFSISRVNYNSDYSGILGSLQIWANRNNGRRSTEGFLINSAPLKVACHWLAKITDRLRVGDAIEIIATKLEPR